MKELFIALKNALDNNRDAILAGIIASSGSTPRGAGAKMLVLENGTTLGTIGGGAIEYKAALMAQDALKTKQCFVENFSLNKDDVADLGMICGGAVTVYFQLFSCNDELDAKLVDHILDLYEKDENSWLITEIKKDGQCCTGTYDEKNNYMYIAPLSAELHNSMICSQAMLKLGDTTYFAEPLVRSGKVYVFGGGHISQELIPMIEHVGFKPVVFEDRADFARPELFKGKAKTVLGDFTKVGESITIQPEDYVVIMTRGHQADYVILEHALRSPASYIGLIGSKSKMALTQKKLLEAGIDEKEFARIHNPIGLDIKAETPAEIAVSITAQLILHRANEKLSLHVN